MSNEWFTPPHILERARRVLKRIDVDPASCAKANTYVQAERYYTAEDNGLMQPWYGNVWLNPPYGRIRPEMTGSNFSWGPAFLQKLRASYECGDVQQAIALIMGNSCFSPWFKPFWQYLLCFHSGHLEFLRPDGTTSKNGFGTIFLYMGDNTQGFIEEFEPLGTIVTSQVDRCITLQQPLWR